MNTWWVYSLGFVAQILFASRLLVQWIVSEKQRKVVTPTAFWMLSLIASVLLFVYGFLRNDLAIMLGQFLTYFIYIRNLQLQHKWHKISAIWRYVILILPSSLLLYYILNNTIKLSTLLNNPDIPNWLLILGIISQLIFTLRFVIQWLDSEKQKISVLPLSFWIISLIGAVMILVYAVFRLDWVLIIGHSFGASIYIRNMYLHLTDRKLAQSESIL